MPMQRSAVRPCVNSGVYVSKLHNQLGTVKLDSGSELCLLILISLGLNLLASSSTDCHVIEA